MPDTRRCEVPAGAERPHTQDSWRPGASPPPLDLSYRGVHNESSGKTPSLLARPLTTSRTMALHAAAVCGGGFFPMESATRRRLRCLSAQQHALKHGSWAHEGPTVRLSARRWTAPGETWGGQIDGGDRARAGQDETPVRRRAPHSGACVAPGAGVYQAWGAPVARLALSVSGNDRPGMGGTCARRMPPARCAA